MSPSAILVAAPRPAAFLDRDGVINVDHGYTFRPEDLMLTVTAAAGIRLLNESGYLVIVATNQSGIARGLYSKSDMHRFHAHLSASLEKEGAHIDAYYHAPYHPEGSVARFAIEHDDRKPHAGMLLRAMREWNIRREGSFLIGDKPSDAEAAHRVNLPAALIAKNTGDLLAAVQQMLAEPSGA